MDHAEDGSTSAAYADARQHRRDIPLIGEEINKASNTRHHYSLQPPLGLRADLLSQKLCPSTDNSCQQLINAIPSASYFDVDFDQSTDVVTINMYGKTTLASAVIFGLAAAAPASEPQMSGYAHQSHVSGYTNAEAPYGSASATASGSASASGSVGSVTKVASTFGPDSTIAYTPTSAPNATEVGNTVISLHPTGPTSHGPYSGTPTTTGAVTTDTLALSVGTLPPNPTATYYNTNGKLQNDEPAPYTPAGGLGTNGSLPRYMVESDFDYESITLGLYQEWIELDLFNNGLATFSEEDFIAAGLTAEDLSLIHI